MQINSIPTAAIATSVWASASRTLTSVLEPTTAEDTGVTQISVAAAVGSKGSYVQLIASTAAIVHCLILEIQLSAAATDCVIDIATGAAASEVVKCGNIFLRDASTVGLAIFTITIPLQIPAGTRVAARAQATGAVNALISCQFLE